MAHNKLENELVAARMARDVVGKEMDQVFEATKLFDEKNSSLVSEISAL